MYGVGVQLGFGCGLGIRARVQVRVRVQGNGRDRVAGLGYAALAPFSPLSSPMHRLQSRVWYIGDANSRVWNLRRRCFDLRVEEASWRGGVVARGFTAARLLLLLLLALPE